MDTDVLVVGSVNEDRMIAVRRHVRPGETILAEGVQVSGGGKGANQAAAVARAGARVAFVGAVGDDESGRTLRAELTALGIDVAELRTVPGVTTGTAFIQVSEDGENAIIVDAGANSHVRVELAPAGTRAAVVLAQAEIPPAVVADAAGLAAAIGARFAFNAAPAPASLDEVPRGADPLIVNEHEAAELLGAAAATGTPAEVALALREAAGAHSVVVTLGAEGCLVADESGVDAVPAVRAERVVDTTGAGDAFAGALAAALALGAPLRDAAAAAAAAGSAAVGWEGARPPV
ncbi:PfkB family carbohydrate kinase [Agromyces soli]|uniref:Ribokinase n=1 Tax=Agromyces soli TaxID=659012 RepID=A0ABY4AT12_9MICO|nr:PfkB family carbohydrate kinase [Agromyces soli]UOE26297.1 PfkB family carbohydrate kinase [Agromyces soli]